MKPEKPKRRPRYEPTQEELDAIEPLDPRGSVGWPGYERDRSPMW